MLSSNNKISTSQCIFLLIIVRLTTIYIAISAIQSPPFNQDAWIAELLSIPYSLIISSPILFLLNKYPNLTFIGILKEVLGTTIGIIFSISYVCFFIFILSINDCYLVQFIGSAIMPETPFYIIIIFALFTSGYVVYKGLEIQARYAQILFPLCVLIILLSTIFNLPQMKFSILKPILVDSKFIDINIGAFNIATRSYEIILLAMLSPNLKNTKKINKIFITFTLSYTALLILITITTQAVLGIEYIRHVKFPYFIFTRQINLFNYIQRIESINVLNWFLDVFIKNSIYCYVSSIALKEMFSSKDYKAFIIPIMIVLAIIVLKTDMSKAVVFGKLISYKLFPYISIVFIFIIPFLTVSIYFVKKRVFKL